MEQQAVNRPVPELSLTADSQAAAPKLDRVKTALGTAYMGITCSNCGSDKVIRAGACGCLHPMRHQPGMQLTGRAATRRPRPLRFPGFRIALGSEMQ